MNRPSVSPHGKDPVVRRGDNRSNLLEGLLIAPDVIANRKEFAKLAKERSGLQEIVRTFREWKDVQGQIEGSKMGEYAAHEADPSQLAVLFASQMAYSQGGVYSQAAPGFVP